MDNGGHWQTFNNIEQWKKLAMVDNELWTIRNNRCLLKVTNGGKWKWWAMNNGGQRITVDRGQWWTMDSGGKQTMMDNKNK